MTVTNPYYEFDPAFVAGTKARSGDLNSEFLAVQAAFDYLPGVAAAVTRGISTLGTESGSGNSYVVTMPDTRTSNQEGDLISFRATHANTGAITINVDGLGAVSARHHDGTTELSSGDMSSGVYYTFRYDSTLSRFVMTADTEAANQVTFASQWATYPEDSLIPVAAGGDGSTDYSALHWAAKAAASAASVGTSNVSYNGDHDASGNTAPSTPTNKAMYRISVAGTFGSISWRAGDYAIWDGAAWDKLLPPGAAYSILGVTGSSAADYADITAAADDRVLARTSGAVGFVQLTAGMFPNTVVPDAALSAAVTASLALANSAVQSGDLHAVAFSGSASDIDSGTLGDGFLSSNVALLDSDPQTFTGRTVISGASPEFDMFETDAAANNGGWYFAPGGEQMQFGVYNDARSAFSAYLSVDRTAQTIDQVTLAATELQFDGTTLDVNAAADFSSTVSATGQITSTQTSTGITNAFVASSTNPGYGLSDTDAASDEKHWRLGPTSLFSLKDDYTFGATLLSFTRSGSAWTQFQVNATELEFNGTTLDINAVADFSSTVTISGHTTLSGTSLLHIFDETSGTAFTGLQFKDVGSHRGYFGLQTAANQFINDTAADTLCWVGTAGLALSGDGGTTAHAAISTTGTLTTPNTSASEVGYKGMPLNGHDGSYTLVLSDAGQLMRYNSTGGHTYTIPANASVAFPLGTVITILNVSSSSLTIAITTDTLVWSPAGSTGSRTLAAKGIATIVKATSTTWYISGTGLT